MKDSDVKTDDTGEGRKAWLRRAVPLAALMAASALSLAACSGGSSGPGVAGGGPAASATAQAGGPPSGSSHANALGYSRCMRSHGEPDFPDPDSSGQINLNAVKGKVDPASPQFQSAQNACKSLNPAGNPAQQAQMLAQMVKFAGCMRSHGVPNYPDPHSNGNGPIALLTLGGNPAEGGIPDTPQAERAWRTCQHYLPSQLPGSGS